MCLRIGNAIYPDGEQTVSTLNTARNLVSDPAILPSMGTDQYARNCRLINALADCPLDFLLPERLRLSGDPAVHETRNTARMVGLPKLINHVYPATVLIITEGKEYFADVRSIQGATAG